MVLNIPLQLVRLVVNNNTLATVLNRLGLHRRVIRVLHLVYGVYDYQLVVVEVGRGCVDLVRVETRFMEEGLLLEDAAVQTGGTFVGWTL